MPFFLQQPFHGTEMGVGAYSAGLSPDLKTGASCFLGHEASRQIHWLKCLAFSSEKPQTYLTVPSQSCISRSWQEREEIKFTLYPTLHASGTLKGASTCILLAPTVCFPWLGEWWDDLYSVETFGIISSFVPMLWLLLSKSCGALWNVQWMHFPLFHSTSPIPLLLNRPVLYLLMGSFRWWKHHVLTHFQNRWINPDTDRFWTSRSDFFISDFFLSFWPFFFFLFFFSPLFTNVSVPVKMSSDPGWGKARGRAPPKLSG